MLHGPETPHKSKPGDGRGRRDRSPQRPRQPSFPPVPHAEHGGAAVVVPVLAGGIAEDGGEEPETTGGPRRHGHAHGSNGREDVDEEEQRRAVGCWRVRGVDKAELQVEGGREEGDQLVAEGRPFAAEEEGPEERHEGEGE